MAAVKTLIPSHTNHRKSCFGEQKNVRVKKKRNGEDNYYPWKWDCQMQVSATPAT